MATRRAGVLGADPLTTEGGRPSIGTRDAFILAAICLPPSHPRAPGHRLRHALLLRVIGVRASMRRLEKAAYLEPGWSVDERGAHCRVTESGRRIARVVAVSVSIGPDGGPLSKVVAGIRLILNLHLDG